MAQSRSVLQIILDGFGKNPLEEGNAVFHAKTPTLDYFIENYPYSVIEASGIAVGLPWGEVGNSEVGHTNLGSGQVVYQNLPRIDLAIENDSLSQNKKLIEAIQFAKKNKSKLHLLGIVSNGGVHGHIRHLLALLGILKKQKFFNVYIHAILDGRDTASQAAPVFIKNLQETIKKNKVGQIASLIGRYYAMDRNNNWDRTQKSYDLMTQGTGRKIKDPIRAIHEAYKQNLNDEIMEPLCVEGKKGEPLCVVEDKDVILFFNFRPDRARQITKAFVMDKFDGFERKKKDIHFVTMMEYEKNLPVEVLFEAQEISNPVGRIISQAGKNQLRIAETEKYAHVTYFYNGGNEEPYPAEDHILVPSPDVESYDQKPRMSSDEVTKKLIKAIEKKKYDYLLVNYANPDMIGHTGHFKAVVEAIEAVDEHLKKLYNLFVREQGGIMLITADHGNSEVMIDPVSGKPNKEHTTNPVGLYLIDPERKGPKDLEWVEHQKINLTPIGILADVGPTVLELLGLEKDDQMTGRSLVNDCC